jgi:hypothetical protein
MLMSLDHTQPLEIADSRWPHRLAWVAACATLVLIWVTGLVGITLAKSLWGLPR